MPGPGAAPAGAGGEGGRERCFWALTRAGKGGLGVSSVLAGRWAPACSFRAWLLGVTASSGAAGVLWGDSALCTGLGGKGKSNASLVYLQRELGGCGEVSVRGPGSGRAVRACAAQCPRCPTSRLTLELIFCLPSAGSC